MDSSKKTESIYTPKSEQIKQNAKKFRGRPAAAEKERLNGELAQWEDVNEFDQNEYDKFAVKHAEIQKKALQEKHGDFELVDYDEEIDAAKK